MVLKVLEGPSEAAGGGTVEVRGDTEKAVLAALITSCAFSDHEKGTEPRRHFFAGVAARAFGAFFPPSGVECMRKGDAKWIVRLEKSVPLKQ